MQDGTAVMLAIARHVSRGRECGIILARQACSAIVHAWCMCTSACTNKNQMNRDKHFSEMLPCPWFVCYEHCSYTGLQLCTCWPQRNVLSELFMEVLRLFNLHQEGQTALQLVAVQRCQSLCLCCATYHLQDTLYV